MLQDSLSEWLSLARQTAVLAITSTPANSLLHFGDTMTNQPPLDRPSSALHWVVLVLALWVGRGTVFAQQSASDDGPPVGQTPPTNASTRNSLNWMTESLQRVAKKLDAISEKIDPDSTQEQIELEVKAAIHEAFSEFSNDVPAATPPAQPEIPTLRTPKAPLNSAPVPAPIAEIDSPLAAKELDSPMIMKSVEPGSVFLSERAPSWVRDRIVSDEVVRLPIESSLFFTPEECRDDLDERLVEIVHAAIREHVLTSPEVVKLSNLTKEYIQNHLIRPGVEFDNVMERPSGVYHQLWKLIQIGPEQIAEIKSWERREISHRRIQDLGAGAIVALTLLSGFSGGVHLLAKREQRDQRNRPKRDNA
jgi:hypothetical protein